MQTARDSSRPKRCNRRRNSRKKSLSPSDLKITRDRAVKLNRRSLSEDSVKVKHRKSIIRRTLTHPITCCDGGGHEIKDIRKVFGKVKLPESDESNLPQTSSDRDTEDDVRVPRILLQKPRWDLGSEMDSLVSTVVRRASARRRRTPANTEWGASVISEPGEGSEPEAGRMRPEDYRLVFLSSDSSCREDTEDSSSTTSSAAPLATDDCDWDYFESGAAQPLPSQLQRHLAQPCSRPCSCGAEPRLIAVPVPVPVPVPAALWPTLLTFPAGAPPPAWTTYPGLALDAAALATLTSAAARAAATVPARTDKASQSDPAEPIANAPDNDNIDKGNIDADGHDASSCIEERMSPDGQLAMPEHLRAEEAFPSSGSSNGSDADNGGGARRSYDVSGAAPDEPPTSDSDSDDSGGGGGRFSRVFVVNPIDSSSEREDDPDSSGIDCDDTDDKKSDNLEVYDGAPHIKDDAASGSGYRASTNESSNSNIFLLDSICFSDDLHMIPCRNEDQSLPSPAAAADAARRSEFFRFCDENMLRSETCERYNSFTASSGMWTGNLDNDHDGSNRSRSPAENIECDSLDNAFIADSDMKVKVVVELPDERNDLRDNAAGAKAAPDRKPPPSPEHDRNEASPPTPDKIDLFKGIERTLSELLKKELLEEREEKTTATGGECGGATQEGAAGEAAAAAGGGIVRARAVSPPREADTDVCARYTSRVMITHSRAAEPASAPAPSVTVHHTNQQADGPPPAVTVLSNADTLSAVVCLEEGLADDDSWVEDVSADDASSPSDSDSGDEARLQPRADEFAYCRRSLDFTLHTIVEESCEESDTDRAARKSRPISATELEKYFFFGLGDGRNVRDDEAVSEASSVCSEGGDSIVDGDQSKRTGDSDELVSSRLEKYFLSGFMGFNQEQRDSDGSGSVGSDSEGRQSPEQRRKRLVRARGAPRSHSNSLDNLLTGDEPPQDVQEASDGSSTETEERHDSTERLDAPADSKRKKQTKKSRGSPGDECRQSAEFTEDTRDDARSVSEGEDGRISPRPEFPPLGSELSESKKQTSRDSGFVGSCDDLLRNGDSSSEFSRNHEPKTELEEIIEELRPDAEERIESPPTSRPPPSPLARKDSFNNWSSDEETNLMMTKMRQFFKQMVNAANVRTPMPASATSNSETPRPPKPPQLLYFESELTRLMKTVPGIRDEEVREIVEYLSSEDTWSDSYDSSDYAGSDLEGVSANRSVLRKQISESCREIIDEFDKGNSSAGSLERDAAGAYRRLAATLGRAGEGSPPLFGKVMRHIGGRLVALMHEVSGGASTTTTTAATTTTDDDSASEPGALSRSRSHDVLEPTASRGSVASDSERFSWRGSFESALLAADSRGTLGGGGEARRSPAGVELASQRSHSRSCGAISGSEDKLWKGRRRASAPDAESEEEQRSGSLPRLPVAGAGSAGPVKSARYRAPGFRTATRAASAPGLHAPRRRRALHSHAPIATQAPAVGAASAPSLQDEVSSESMSSGHATLPRRSNSPLPHETELDRERFPINRSGLQARSESMASVYSGAGEGCRGNVTVRGDVQFSLLYNYRLGALEVGVKRCRDLAPVDVKKNRSDPYVKVYLLPDKSKAGKRKTKVKKNTLNPVFEETLAFVQPLSVVSARTLWLSAWHADIFGRNDFLGEVTLPLHDVVFDDPAPKWYKLKERTEQFEEHQGTRGDLIVALKLELEASGGARAGQHGQHGQRGQHAAGTLHVLVKEAKDLVATKPNGLADVFCKSYLLPERGRGSKQKSRVVRRTLSPRFEHTFTYSVAPSELPQRALELSLWDRDRLAANDFMGAVRLSTGTGMYMGAAVNWMDSSGKEVSLWETMMLRPNFWVEGCLPLRPQLNH